MTKQIAAVGAAIMSALLALVVVWQFRTVALYLLISLMFAAALRPLSHRLARLKIMVRVAWIALYLAVLGAFGFLLFLTAGRAGHEIQQLAQSLSDQNTWRLPVWLEGSAFQQALVARLPAPSMLFTAMTGEEGQLVLPVLLGISQGLGTVVSAAIIILFLGIYWAGNQNHFERLWLSLLPSVRRKQVREIWRLVESELGAYLRSEFARSLLAGLVLSLGYWLLGSPFPVLLALAGALATLVPMIGVVMAVVPVLLVGLLTSVPLSLFTMIFTLVVLMVVNVFIKPRLLSHRWENPILTIFLIIALEDAFGLAGIIAAPPFSVVIQILWSHLVNRRETAGAAARISDLKERQARMWDTIREMEEEPPELVTSSMKRLADLIEQAEPVLGAAIPADIAVPRNEGLPGEIGT
ncbi:MAG TPA: AI-2E family transporter [Anaerolineales bacterium]|nr:AI-2E family transporter [Anaerolineales bacterium]